MRLTLPLVFIGAGLVLMALWLQQFNFGLAELKFIADFGLGAIGFIGTLLAALATAHLFFREIDGGAVAYILTRPVRRWEYVCGKLIGTAALLALFTFGLGALLAGILFWRGHQLGVEPLAGLVFIHACALQWLKITLVAAMTMLVCSYAGTALFAACAGLLLAMVANLQSFVGEEGWLVFLRLWPDLTHFNPELLLAGEQQPTVTALLALTGYWSAYMILFGALASYVFKHREL